MTNLVTQAEISSKCVLVADDEDTLRELFSRYLTIQGYEVTSVNDGQELLDSITREAQAGREYVAAFTDNYMPNLEGVVAVEKARAQFPEMRTVFCLGSSAFDQELKDRALAAGVFELYDKPFDHISDLGKIAERACAEYQRKVGATVTNPPPLNP